MSKPAHSSIGASSAHRWLSCPGSVRLCRGMPKDSSKYAMEGTAAHQLAERCLRQGVPAAEFIDQAITVDGTPFTVDEEMAEGVQVYLDAIQADRRPGDVMVVEERFDISSFYPGMFGTNDCSLYRPDTGELIVFDLKFGRGVAVSVDANPQLLYYGLGAATAVPGRKLTSVELVVVQPRCQHQDGPVRRWRTDALTLLEWSADLVDAAQATASPDAPLRAGHHCKFCPAAPVCPALQAHVLTVAQAEFAPNENDEDTITVKSPEKLSPAELAVVLREAQVIEDWLNSVRAYAHCEAEAGRTPPGFKLVNKQGRRVWMDPAEALDFLRSLHIDDESIHEPRKIRSPAQIEVVLGKLKMDKKSIVPLVVSRSSGTTLVHESNARPAVAPSAIQDFQDK